ncbi:MAG: thioredoxin family protein [Chloroflexota bacterium]
MEIKILGPGCPKCRELDKRAKEVVKELGVAVSIEHITDVKKIMAYPILTTPGLVINEELVFSGRVPTRKEIAGFINNARAKEQA